MTSDFFKPKKSKKSLKKSIIKHREAIEGYVQGMGSPANVLCIEFTVTLSDSTKLPATIYRPEGMRGPPYPTLFHIPGSAFNTLNPHPAHIIGSQLAEKTGCQVIIINHRLAPEFQFPIGQEDAFKVFNIMMQGKDRLQIDEQHVFLSGYSSGGTYAAIVALRAAQQSLKIQHLFLASPVVDFSDRPETHIEKRENKDTGVSPFFVDSMKNYYIPAGQKLDDPKLSPYWETNLEGFPPTDILCGTRDRFLGNSVAYANKLRNNGVEVVLNLIKKDNHASFWFNIREMEYIGHRILALMNPIPKSLFFETEAEIGKKLAFNNTPRSVESKDDLLEEPDSSTSSPLTIRYFSDK